MKEHRQDKAAQQKAADTEEQSRRRIHKQHLEEAYKQHLDERLDEALLETFPASDPVALTPRPRRHLSSQMGGGRSRPPSA